MPLYHFDLWHGTGWTADASGVELPDDAAAAAYGYEVARDIARNKERDARTFCITVRDAARCKLFILPFSDLAELFGDVDPATRAALEISFARQRELGQALHAARAAVAESRAALARSRGKPYLVAWSDGVLTGP